MEEDSIETMCNNDLEPYRSAYIWKILTDCQASISTINFLSPEGTTIALPNDGPPLPDDFIASITDHNDDAIKTAYFNVDTGATCVVTDKVSEFHCLVPTHATCGTAAKGPRTTINAMGWLVLDFVTDKGVTIPFELPNATDIQQFQQHSLSCHALKDLGFDVQHALLASGNLLRLGKISSDNWHAIPLVTHGRSNYVKVNLHLPAVAGIMPFSPHQALTEQTVACLDLINKFSGHSDVYACTPQILLRKWCHPCCNL
jgi:hypothetical protein